MVTPKRPFGRELSYKVHKLQCLLDRLVARTLKEKLDLSFSQFLILLALRRHSELSQRDIVQFLHVTEAAVSRQIDLLSEKRLLAREENKENRREHVLTLTSAGREKVGAAVTLLDRTFDEVFEKFGAGEKDALMKHIDRLVEVVWEKGKDLFSLGKEGGAREDRQKQHP